MKKALFNCLGWLALITGVIGAFMPILPTTPFLLLASYFFSKGSPKFHDWLINNKYFGSKIRDWQDHGVISTKSKIVSSALILTTLSYFLFFTDRALWIKTVMILILSCCLIFINTRPGKK